jgi:hypothetical protein
MTPDYDIRAVGSFRGGRLPKKIEPAAPAMGMIAGASPAQPPRKGEQADHRYQNRRQQNRRRRERHAIPPIGSDG